MGVKKKKKKDILSPGYKTIKYYQYDQIHQRKWCSFCYINEMDKLWEDLQKIGCYKIMWLCSFPLPTHQNGF